MPNFSKAICLSLFVFLFCSASATDYYFSTSDGDDNRSVKEAQNPATPWQSLAKLNAVFGGLRPGDAVYFKRGDVFTGSVNVTASGASGSPITLGAYGSGAQPVISGLATLTGWSSIGNNVWETNLPVGAAQLNVLLINGAFTPIGRYPNADAANGGYLTVRSHQGHTSIFDNGLTGSPNWSGGDVVIRKARWVLDRNLITQHNGNTIHYASESDYDATDGYGYFIQNHIRTLDRHGEWFYGAGSVGVYIGSGSPSSYTIQGSVVENLVNVVNQHNVRFADLTFRGANKNAFQLSGAQGISIIGCTVQHTGVNAVNAGGSGGLTVEGSQFNWTNNVALNLENCDGSRIYGNTLAHNGSVAGMGKGNSGSYDAILHSTLR